MAIGGRVAILLVSASRPSPFDLVYFVTPRSSLPHFYLHRYSRLSGGLAIRLSLQTSKFQALESRTTPIKDNRRIVTQTSQSGIEARHPPLVLCAISFCAQPSKAREGNTKKPRRRATLTSWLPTASCASQSPSVVYCARNTR
jgi:hypothetical protein